MGGKLVLTRLCHGLTPTVQLLEKLFYLHTLNDLIAISFLFFYFFAVFMPTRCTADILCIYHLRYSFLLQDFIRLLADCPTTITIQCMRRAKNEREREKNTTELNRKVA